MNLLLTGAWRDAGKYFEYLEASGHKIAFLQNEADPLPCEYEWVQGVVCNGLFLHHDVRAFTSLQYVQLTSAGYDRVDVGYLSEKGAELHNARGVYSAPMAEHAVAAVLYFYRNLRLFMRQQKDKVWQKDRNLRELSGAAVCIVGCGSVGQECAKRFSAFGCDVIGIDLNPTEKDGFERIDGIADLKKSIGLADVVVLTLPLTDQTEGLVEETFLNTLKEGCILVNIARGGIVRTDALINTLSKRKLYAALDVFEEEPLSADSPLWSMENVLITPHNSFISDRIHERLSRCILHGLTHSVE